MSSMITTSDHSYLAPFGRMARHQWLRWAALILVVASIAIFFAP